MNSENPQNNNLSVTLPTIFAGLTVGVTTWFVSGNAIATGTGFIGTTVTVGISTNINRKRENERDKYIANLLTQSQHDIKEHNQQFVKNITGEFNTIKQELLDSIINNTPTNQIISTLNQVETILTILPENITELNTQLSQQNQQKIDDLSTINIIQQQLSALDNNMQQNQIINHFKPVEILLIELKTKVEEIITSNTNNAIDNVSKLPPPIKQINVHPNPTELTPVIIVNQENENISEEIITVVQWLKTKNIAFKGYNYHESELVRKEQDKIAEFIGEHYDIINPFFKAVKGNLSKKIDTKNNEKVRRYSVILTSEDRANIDIWKKFYHLLDQALFFEHPKPIFEGINKEGKKAICDEIKINTKSDEHHHRFLNQGGWFESYVYKKVYDLIIDFGFKEEKVIKDRNLEIEFTTENGSFRNGEIDMLFIIQNQPLWIECKVAISNLDGTDVVEFANKYSERREKLSIPKERAFLFIWWGLEDEKAELYTSKSEITLVNRNSFEKKIKKALQNIAHIEATKIDKQMLINSSPLQVFGQQYCPEKKYRKGILQSLIKLFAKNVNEGLDLYDVKDELSGELPDIDSKIMYQILDAVWRGGCLCDRQEQPIIGNGGFYKKATKILPEYIGEKDADTERNLERKCLEVYVRVIVTQIDSNFFRNSDTLDENHQQFEEIFGHSIKRETLEEIDQRIFRN